MIRFCKEREKTPRFFSVLELVVWQEGLIHCLNVEENTVICSVLQVVGQEILNH